MTSVTHSDTGLNVVETAAIAGNADAQYKLGLMYLLGEGVERDYTQALQWFDMAATQGLTKALYGLLQLPLQWFRSAAIQGNMLAQYYLGMVYCPSENVQQDYPLVALHLKGWYGSDEAVEQDYAQALKWYSKAAAQGEGRAHLALGWMYFQGKGVTKDHAQALQYYANAAAHGCIVQCELNLLGTIQQAEAGDVTVQYSLGLLYYQGKFTERNHDQALHWFQKAAEQGHADAQFKVGEMHYQGNGVTQNTTKALQWIEKAAAQGSADAQFRLGMMYRKGEEVPLDHVQALHWLLKAATQGHDKAQYELWWLYRRGKSVEKNSTQALYWLKQAAIQGHSQAQETLGSMYRRGCDVEQDYVQALYWFYQEANTWASNPVRVAENNLGLSVEDYVERGLIDQENSFVQYYLGLLNSENGDDDSAAQWYAKAAAQGYAQAQSALGWSYYLGDGVDQDDQQALLWYERAAAQGVIEEPDTLDKLRIIQDAFDGDAVAQYTLGLMYHFDYGDVRGDDEQAFAWFEIAAM
ncbi:MAG: SEL1-like repeat protein [Candidatus Thiothrix putei]|uniref:SEL1-like repeat protein n=1 Tax=Candidatus Thiothrix putei TaxID=3080811 RepID=A0AA95H9N2_9GAMM|nr:MAG: SEL1-like repeat protein [Candidatus Thiothrix putei]